MVKKELFFVFVLVGCCVSGLGASEHVVHSFPTPGDCPSGLTWDGKALWSADWQEQKLYRIDPENGQVLNTLPSPGFFPQGLAWGNGRLYVSDGESRKIYVLNPETGMVERSYRGPGHSPKGLGWDGEHLLVVDDATDRVYKLNPEDGTLLGSFQAPDGNARGLCFDGKTIWVSDRIRDALYAVIPDEGAVAITLPAPGPFSCGLAWDGKHLWNADFEMDAIYKLDPKAKKYSTSDTWNGSIELIHFIRNSGPGSLEKAEIYLAIPPKKLENQELLSAIRFNPKPDRFTKDSWGQKVAVYQFSDVGPGETVSASYKVDIQVEHLRYHVIPENVGRLEDVPAEIREKYLTDGSRLLIHDPVIQQAVQEAVGAERNPFWMAKKIHKYILDHVRYEGAGGWDTAPVVLARGSGSCSEAAFVLIALCRAAGLPARFESGSWRRDDNASVDTDNHRWGEVYLPNYGWVPCDAGTGGQKLNPASVARFFGELGNHLFVTTYGAGDSEFLGWEYNSKGRCTFKGRCEVKEGRYFLWDRAKGQ